MAKVNLIVYLCDTLKCSKCEGVLLQLEDPTLLAVNDGQPIENWRSFVRGTVESFQKVQLNQTNQIGYEYVISYESTVLLDPTQHLQDCDIKRVCCADCVIDYLDELTLAPGTPPNPNEMIINRSAREGVFQPGATVFNNYYVIPFRENFDDEEHWHIQIPIRWDFTQDPIIRFSGILQNASDGDLHFELGYAHRQDNQDVTQPLNTFLFTEPVGAFAKIANGIHTTSLSNPQLDRTLLIPGASLHIRLRRLGTDLLDTQSGDYNVFRMTVLFPLSNFGGTS